MSIYSITKKIIQNLPSLIYYISSSVSEKDNQFHGELAINWLRNASRTGQEEGFPHSFHFFRGWQPAYPETTGYIIPTLLLASKYYLNSKDTELISKAFLWLQKIQHNEGYFNDLNNNPQVFDTGQILIGANYLFNVNQKNNAEFIKKMTDWIVGKQSEDGSFISCSYNNQPHAYYSRVGAALIQSGIILKNETSLNSGIKNLDWVLKQQKSNDWINLMSFSDHPPFSHTIIYTLEGLLAGYQLTKNPVYLESVIRFAKKLMLSIESTGGFLRSQYTESFLPTNNEICVTGLCQWTALCFRLKKLGFLEFEKQALSSLSLCKKLQIQSPCSSINGGLPGSSPITGKYMRYSIPNWGVKFFLDCLLASEDDCEIPYLL